MAENKESTALCKAETSAVGIYDSTESYANAWKIATNLAKSQMVPDTFRGKPEDCIIALDLAQRMHASPFAVLQQMYIVHGKPSFSAAFLIACINQSHRFTPLQFKETGEKGKPSWGCICYAKSLFTGDIVCSPEVTIAMATAEGWTSKAGSKWKTMPELMLHYRTATLFSRLYAPDIAMGMITTEEAEDITANKEKEAADRKSAFAATVVQEESTETSEGESEEDKVAKAIADGNVPVSVEDVKAFCEKTGSMFVADLVIPNLNKIAEKILNQGKEAEA